MEALRSAHLFSLHVDLKAPWDLGATPLGHRQVFDVVGGSLQGRVNGTLMSSGADWLLTDQDGTRRLDVRHVARLDDGALLYTQTTGRIHFPPDVLAEAPTRDKLVAMDPSRYYFRVAASYETASETYRWLNRVQAVGVGRLTSSGVACEVFEVL